MLIHLKTSKLLLTNGLSHNEFKCKCNYKECRSTLVNELLLKAYGRFRTDIDTMLHINSGYRCPRHNLIVGGSERSRHQSGEAIDIDYATLKDEFSHEEIIDKLRCAGFTYVQWYADLEFFHCDVRPVYN